MNQCYAARKHVQMCKKPLSEEWLLQQLQEEQFDKIQNLLDSADHIRAACVGDEVHLRGLVELTNFCSRACGYCGLRSANRAITRYRMSVDEIVDCAHQAETLGCGTLVLQGGEDLGFTKEMVGEVILRVKQSTRLAITLSLGERKKTELEYWRKLGADRYFIRFETSDPVLYDHIHPGIAGGWNRRIELLQFLKSLDYETGSGIMVGIPGQRLVSLVRDVQLFRELDLDMVGIGPWIPHPDTPLFAEKPKDGIDDSDCQTLLTLKLVALARIACPQANIPSTTALSVKDPENGRRSALLAGANICMPNLTPIEYREHYEIYPGKPATQVSSQDEMSKLDELMDSIGRCIGRGHGGRTRTGSSWKNTGSQLLVPSY